MRCAQLCNHIKLSRTPLPPPHPPSCVCWSIAPYLPYRPTPCASCIVAARTRLSYAIARAGSSSIREIAGPAPSWSRPALVGVVQLVNMLITTLLSLISWISHPPPLGNVGVGADVLIHEATFDDELMDEAVAKRHCTIGEVCGPSLHLTCLCPVGQCTFSRYRLSRWAAIWGRRLPSWRTSASATPRCLCLSHRSASQPPLRLTEW